MSDVAIVDVGTGNIGSVAMAFERLGAAVVRTADPAVLADAARIVLPGVGAAGHVMARLADAGLVEPLRRTDRPLLGICLGMQLMYEATEEGGVAGLGILPGRVRRLVADAAHKVPHMGWSPLAVRQPAAALGLASGDHVYFAHSFACDDGDAVVAVADHGRVVPAMARQGRICAVQFHPERSGPVGARLLDAFLRC